MMVCTQKFMKNGEKCIFLFLAVDDSVALRLYLGMEYECPRGHRFFCSSPDKIFKAPSSGIFKVMNLRLYYRPQTLFAKVMFLQVSVCPQGGLQAHIWGGRLGVWRGEGGSPGPHPGGGWGVWPGGSPGPHPVGRLGVWLGGGLQAHIRGEGIPPCTEADTPPHQTATAAGGTHSCLYWFPVLYKKELIKKLIFVLAGKCTQNCHKRYATLLSLSLQVNF